MEEITQRDEHHYKNDFVRAFLHYIDDGHYSLRPAPWELVSRGGPRAEQSLQTIMIGVSVSKSSGSSTQNKN